ncbi:hypothetical protein JX266_008537 [Neoarthrinium moseri]|nr:hypothetical protein JX266_008537 [Neoarthrinium moseri]
MFHSPRYLYFRHVQRALRRQGAITAPLDEDLQPGEEHLRSYFVPGVQAGKHTIQVCQTVSAVGEPLQTLSTPQDFNVLAPQFVLPDNAIHTCYPPQGFSTTAETLPHVIFNDPTFPWERVGSWNAKRNPPDDYVRNRTPWVAVLVFTEDELKLADDDLRGPNSLFQDIQGLKDAEQDSNFAVALPVGQLSKIRATVSPYTTDETDLTTVNTVLIKRVLFNGLFSKYNDKGQPEIGNHPYVYHHRFLAHKRVINTQGMAVTGPVTGDDTGSFGVVVSNRSGPSNMTIPTAVYVHLVSIEGIEQMTPWPMEPSTKYVSLVSLASWSYVCLPPETANVRDELLHLGDSLGPLRPILSADTEAKLAQKLPTGPRLLERLHQGYSLSRYRTQSGEVSSCFIRGPFVPVGKYCVPNYVTKTSMTGLDLSILDGDLATMDISYSAAWQLGRTMAIADQAFTTCLYRVRTVIIQRAADAARDNYVIQYTWHKNKENLLSNLKSSVDRLGLMLDSDGLLQNGSIRQRWERTTTDSLDLSYHGLIVDGTIDPNFDQAARDVASTPDPKDPSKPSDKPYDEFNAPFSADWVVVLRWVLDALFFTNIPAHYLLSDASHLPQESLRFFMVDDNWMNAFLDGALSLGNHIDRTQDKVRNAIKVAINWYLSSSTSVHSYPSPVPKYGCFIRSAVISQFPDLIVEVASAAASAKVSAGDQAPILLRHEVLDKGTMLCLFSQPPSPSSFSTLTFTQPPHQQSFAVGEKVTSTKLTIAERRAYTVKDPDDPEHRLPLDEFTWEKGVLPADGRKVVYLWDVVDPSSQTPVDLRMLLMENFADDYHTQLINKMAGSLYSDDTATSALMAWQLNELSYMLPIQSSTGLRSPGPTRPRKLPVHRRTPPQPPPPPKRSQKTATRSSDPFVSYDERKQLARDTVGPLPPPAARDPMARRTMVTPAPRYLRERHGEGDGLGDSLFPDIRFFFWSLENPGTPDDPGKIKMLKDARGKALPQSLVFSVRIAANAFEDFQIEAIEIIIPQGPAPKATRAEGNSSPSSDTTVYPLTTLYDGPGAAMLSNLRFNPTTFFSTTYDELIIRLIPRSLNEFVTADMCTDMSFLLSGVKVNVSSEEITVTPTINLYYRRFKKQQPTQYPPPCMVLTPVS